LKPAKVKSAKESAPPHSMAFWRPVRIRSAPQPMAVADDEQAVVMLP
jgi:hypothetical protein